MTHLPWMLAACATNPPPVAAPPSAAERVEDLRLAVSQLAPGQPVGLRVVGPAGASVGIVRGTPGGPECPAGFFGACFDLLGAQLLGSLQTNRSGAGRLEITVPLSAVVGESVAFQAMIVNGGVATLLSPAVPATVEDAAAWAPPTGYNVLIVLVDDVGVDRIGLYGAPAPATTPVLDDLAAGGLVFENAWAMPLCGPTRAALQTGRLPRRTGHGTNLNVQLEQTEIDPDLTTIAELVDYTPWYDYETSYVGKWHLAAKDSPSGPLSPKVQGWDWWTGLLSSVEHWWGPNPGGEDPSYFHFQVVNNRGRFVDFDSYATTKSVDDAIERIDKMNQPWMLQVSFNAAHEPFHEPPDALHADDTLNSFSSNADLHRAMIEAMDTELGRLLDSIPADVRDHTMIFYLGDNGTDRLAAEGAEDPLRMKGSLYDGGIHVPFVVAGPLVTRPGRTDALAHVVDLFPTIAEIAGADLSMARGGLDGTQPLTIDGVSLVPALVDPSVSVRDTLYAEKFWPGGGGPYYSDARTIRDDRYKLSFQATCGTESFYEYVDGAPDEGDDLLPAGLTLEQEEARARLRATMDELVAGLAYDADSWPVVPDPGQIPCGMDTGDTGLPANGDG